MKKDPEIPATSHKPLTTIVIRTPSGLSGDMTVTGLAKLAGLSQAELKRQIA